MELEESTGPGYCGCRQGGQVTGKLCLVAQPASKHTCVLEELVTKQPAMGKAVTAWLRELRGPSVLGTQRCGTPLMAVVCSKADVYTDTWETD